MSPAQTVYGATSEQMYHKVHGNKQRAPARKANASGLGAAAGFDLEPVAGATSEYLGRDTPEARMDAPPKLPAQERPHQRVFNEAAVTMEESTNYAASVSGAATADLAMTRFSLTPANIRPAPS